MGQAASRDSGNRTYAPKSPFTVTPGLEATLDKSSESDFSRQQLSTKYIEDRVAERLYDARVEAEGRLRDAQTKVGEVLPPSEQDSESGLSSPNLQKQLSQLTDALERQPKHGQLDESGEKVRGALLECFKKNQGRVLDCRAEFAKFQEEVRDLEKRLAGV